MSQTNVEKRLVILEQQVARLTEKLGGEPEIPWWKQIYGAFADDPIYDEAMRLGREYRESLRPPERSKKKAGVKKNGHPRHRSDNAAKPKRQ
jgi:hypothetical protein